VFNILDHYSRRNEAQERVIGTLLGSTVGGNVEIRNSIPVPHHEGEEQLAIDVEFQRTMYDMHLKVCSRDVIVGWYSTGFTDHNQLIHDFYRDKLPTPVHLLVDPSMKTGRVVVKALVSAPLSLGSLSLGQMFKEVPYSFRALDLDKLCLNMMAEARFPQLKKGLARLIPQDELTRAGDATSGATPALGAPRTAISANQLKTLIKNLDRSINYVQRVLNESTPADPTIGRTILESLNDVPLHSSELFEKVFSDSVQDMLMVMYLAKFTKTHLLLSEKLHAQCIAPA
jgi:translation initiation factor 3 subunit F